MILPQVLLELGSGSASNPARDQDRIKAGNGFLFVDKNLKHIGHARPVREFARRSHGIRVSAVRRRLRPREPNATDCRRQAADKRRVLCLRESLLTLFHKIGTVLKVRPRPLWRQSYPLHQRC